MGHKALRLFFVLSSWNYFVVAQPFRLVNELDIEKGLSQTTNTYFHQDQRGFVWISSVDGLNRFDGQQVKVFKSQETNPGSIAGNNIQSPFFETSNGDIWFTTDIAINCYRAIHARFDHYYLGGTGDNSNLGTHSAFFLEKNRYLWISFNKNLYKFDIKNPNAPAICIANNFQAARVVVDTNKRGSAIRLYCAYWDYAPGFEIIHLKEDGQIANREVHLQASSIQGSHYKVKHVYSNNSGIIWLLTNKGILEFDVFGKKILTWVKDGNHFALAPISGKEFAIGGNDGGIYIFDISTQKITRKIDLWYQKDQYALQNLNHLKDGILWGNAPSKGVVFFLKKPPRFTNPVSNHSIWSIYENAPGQVWLCGIDDHSYLCQPPYQKTEMVDSKPYAKVFKDAQGNIWRFSVDGLALYNRQTRQWKNRLKPPQSASFSDLFFLKNDTLLVGTIQGLIVIHLKTLNSYSLNNTATYALGIDKYGRIWQGTSNSIIVLENQRADTLRNTGDPLHFVGDKADDNIMWVGTSKGLIKFNLIDLSFETINQQSGLPNQYIYAIAQDAKGFLWLSTNQGIIRFHPDQKPYRFKQYTARDGLSSNEFNPGAVLTDSRGHIWFGSTKGVDVFHPDSVRDLGHAPQLAIVGLKIHDRPWQSDTAIEVARRIDLPHDQNTLRLELAAMEYLDPARNQFKVMLQLEGETAAWTDLGTQNFVTYANLKPGKYTFRFIACNAEGIWVDEKDARTLYIAIHPHWTDTWWFRALLVLGLLAFVATATAFYYRYRLRVQQLASEKQQREAERQRLELEKTAALAEEYRKTAESEMKLLRAQLNPHFLFNAMNSVNRYILSNEKEKASEYLGDFAQLTRSILDNSRNLTIPLADELRMLEQYLRLENHRFAQQITWEITVDPDLDDEEIQVPSMFLQPFAENAILHGLAPKGGGHIEIRIEQRDGYLCCTLRDNGVGRHAKPDAPQEGALPKRASVGMRLIAERLDAFAGLQGGQAEVLVQDLKDTAGNALGTAVEVRIPI